MPKMALVLLEELRPHVTVFDSPVDMNEVLANDCLCNHNLLECSTHITHALL